MNSLGGLTEREVSISNNVLIRIPCCSVYWVQRIRLRCVTDRAMHPQVVSMDNLVVTAAMGFTYEIQSRTNGIVGPIFV